MAKQRKAKKKIKPWKSIPDFLDPKVEQEATEAGSFLKRYRELTKLDPLFWVCSVRAGFTTIANSKGSIEIPGSDYRLGAKLVLNRLSDL